MKLTDRQKMNLKAEVEHIRNTTDVEMTAIICKISNDFHKQLRDIFVPYIDNGYFKGKGDLFALLIVSICSMITVKEMEALSNNDDNKYENIKSLFLDKLNTSRSIRKIDRENPGLFADH